MSDEFKINSNNQDHLLDPLFEAIAELSRLQRNNVTAERRRCREEEVQPLLKAIQEALNMALGEWATVNNHPASGYADDVKFYRETIAAVQKVQQENP
jgi:hypothetical protein